MDRLAMHGGQMVIRKPLPRYNSIGSEELSLAKQAIRSMPLSGFLGGNQRGGHYIQRLEELWSHRFKARHSIACNSATSGLLAACVAAGVGPKTSVVTTPFTMSATAAAPKLLGANVAFGDIEEVTYLLDDIPSCIETQDKPLIAIIATNLFGHPARLKELKRRAIENRCWLIEDNAQSILAKEGDKYAGTIGDIGVFSFNVHKHLQVGEGGMICTDNDDLAKALRGFINHGEMAGAGPGLNLRMTEYAAAMVISQLMRIESIVEGRIHQAQGFIKAVKDFNWIKPPVTRASCTHSYYVVPLQYKYSKGTIHRDRIVAALNAEGLPIVAGYVPPLYRLTAFEKCSGVSQVADRLHDETLLYFSNCEWTLDTPQQVTDAFAKVDRAIARGELK